MGLFEAHEEKKMDVRVIERARLFGKMDRKSYEQSSKGLEDVAERAGYSNVDEINAKDNPVHIARGLPSLDAPARRNIEDMEFDSDDANRSFEQ
ncbi:MAG: hypothetical protein ACXWQO_10235 [Bdellovibrionota bacterium]